MQVSSALPTVSVFQTEQTMNVYSYSMAVSELLFRPIGHMNPSSMFIQNRKPFKQLKCSVSLFFMQHLKWTTDILTFNKRKAIVHPALKLYKLFCVSSTEIVQVVLCIQHWNCTSCFLDIYYQHCHLQKPNFPFLFYHTGMWCSLVLP